jgi:probable addiction module antidote protein
MTTFTKFDASEFLDNDEVIAHYLAAALEDENPDLLAAALSDVAKAREISQKPPAASELLRRKS